MKRPEVRVVERRIVCAVDDSDGARDAARAAAAIAGRLECPLALLHVERSPARAGPAPSTHRGSEAPDKAQAEDAGKLLGRLSAELGLGHEVELLVESGDPAAQIQSIAKRDDVAMLVVGSRGRGMLASALFGSVSGAVAVAAGCPVLVVPPGRRLTEGCVVAGVDGSDASGDALQVAIELGRRLRVPLLLAHAFDPRPIAGSPAAPRDREALVMAEQERAQKLLAEVAAAYAIEEGATRFVAGGREADALSSLAEAEHAAVVVVGSRGRGTVRAALLGSVSFELGRTAPCPVLVVPPGAVRSLAPSLGAAGQESSGSSPGGSP